MLTLADAKTRACRSPSPPFVKMDDAHRYHRRRPRDASHHAPGRHRSLQAEPNAKGQRLIWLAEIWLNKLDPCASTARATATSSCGSSNWEVRYKASSAMTAHGRAHGKDGCTAAPSNSPLTKSMPAEFHCVLGFGVVSDGDGAIGRCSGRPDGDVGGDAALAGARLL